MTEKRIFDVNGDDDASDQLADKIAALESELQDEKDGRLEDRFISFVIFVILLDIMLLHGTANVALPIVVLILQLFVFFLLAKRMGSEDVARLIDRLLHSVSRSRGGDAD